MSNDLTHHYADVGEVRLHYVTAGQGPTIVLLHGWPQTWFMWRDVIPGLAKHFEPVVKTIWARHDYSEYGGAPLLGVDGVCIICHGSSDRRAIKNAVRVAAQFVQTDLNNVILSRVAEAAAHDRQQR